MLGCTLAFKAKQEFAFYLLSEGRPGHQNGLPGQRGTDRYTLPDGNHLGSDLRVSDTSSPQVKPSATRAKCGLMITVVYEAGVGVKTVPGKPIHTMHGYRFTL